MTAKIVENITNINRTIQDTAENCGRDPSTIRLVAVSKRHPENSIHEAMDAGQRIFGESYIQEAYGKYSQLQNTPAEFHFIGHLQTNKAKMAAEIFTMIETVDRYKLAKALNKHLEKLDRNIEILVQVNIGRDPKKSGVLPEECEGLLEQIGSLTRLHLRGLMTIPPYSNDPEETRAHFKDLRLLAVSLVKKGFFPSRHPIELSMGMSGDYQIAIEEGATLIRIGTAIFGERDLPH